MSKIIDKFAVGEQAHKLALSFAANTPAEVNAAVSANADRKAEISMAPVQLYMRMLTKMDEDTLNTLPVIGSRLADVAGTNQLPDLFHWKDPSKDNDDGKEVSFYTVWPDNTPEGISVANQLDWLKRLGDDTKIKTGIPADFAAMYGDDVAARSVLTRKLENRRGNIRKDYKMAVRLMHKMDGINELAAVAAKVEPTADGKGYEADIKVHSTVAGRETRDYAYFSVGTLLKLDTAKAAENGGTLAALKATIARGTPEPVKTDVLKVNSIETPETLDTVAIAIHSYLDKAFADKTGDQYRKLITHVSDTASAQPVLTLYEIKLKLDSLFRMDKVMAIATKAKDEADKVAAAA